LCFWRLEGLVFRHLAHFLSAGELESDTSQIISPTNKVIVPNKYEIFLAFRYENIECSSSQNAVIANICKVLN
jgi:hypothetical protein